MIARDHFRAAVLLGRHPNTEMYILLTHLDSKLHLSFWVGSRDTIWISHCLLLSFSSLTAQFFLKKDFSIFYVTRHIYPLYFLQNLVQVYYHIIQNSMYLHAMFLNISIVDKILIWFQDPFGTSHHSFIVLWCISKICKSCQCLQFH